MPSNIKDTGSLYGDIMDKTRLMEAANYLIDSDSFHAEVKELALIIRDWASKRCYFAGDREPLNELVKLGMEDLYKYQRILDLVESKRMSQPKQRRTAYQAEYMAQRRARLAKAVEIEGLVRGKPLSPDERKEADKRIHAAWSKRKDEFLAEQGELSWNDRNAATSLFWEQIDKELEEQKQAALSMPVMSRKSKRVVKVDREPKSDFGKKIREALRK